MKKAISLAILVFLFFAAEPNLSPRNIPLVAGNLLECTLNEPNLSSQTAKVGDPLVCYARPLRELGCSVFPRGTQLSGRLVDYRKPGRLVGKGWIKLEFDRLILPNGEAPITARVISVHGFKVDAEGRIRGQGHPKRDVLGWAIPILWPVKLVSLPLRGPGPALKGERLVTLRVLDDVRVPCGEFGTGLSSEWRPFDFSTRTSSSISVPKDGLESAGPTSARDELKHVVPTAQERAARSDADPVVITYGLHTLRITSSRPKSAPRTSPSVRE